MHFETTYIGLHHWVKHMFEHVGYMVLAAADDRGYKVAAYKKSLTHLKQAIKDKIESTSDIDKKEDLKILHNRVGILEKHVSKI